MNEPTITDTELIEVIESGWEDEPTEAEQELAATVARNILASDWLTARVAVAVDRERAAWVAKIDALADVYAANGAARDVAGKPAWPNNVARDLRALLAADDTEDRA